MRNQSCDSTYWCQGIKASNGTRIKELLPLTPVSWLVVEIESNPAADQAIYNSRVLVDGKIYITYYSLFIYNSVIISTL